MILLQCSFTHTPRIHALLLLLLLHLQILVPRFFRFPGLSPSPHSSLASPASRVSTLKLQVQGGRVVLRSTATIGNPILLPAFIFISFPELETLTPRTLAEPPREAPGRVTAIVSPG
ncbi:hypothetical protein CEP54_008035 [Fusarium duplospermum]|uniref:Uncharacterized protein n=1 Tax=Fusarium duplospermum TaxID=1325734 RepID=A0A428PXV6_9HYPO|nr:hypothetical protein CEP54_008035 [Fusarium duplospermum]